VAVVAAPEFAAQPVVDDRTQLLERAEHLAGRVAVFAPQRDTCAVPRS
jgi:hypothetical protein